MSLKGVYSGTPVNIRLSGVPVRHCTPHKDLYLQEVSDRDFSIETSSTAFVLQANGTVPQQLTPEVCRTMHRPRHSSGGRTYTHLSLAESSKGCLIKIGCNSNGLFTSESPFYIWTNACKYDQSKILSK
ncbi:hypothetical protein CDAR_278701 [Caerostris darwini]|uniref:Uncharacterized protein n=1 Tax=Caerostris darwini TaxID=1538125 RepID=A0AAV4WQ98_9ARAC|nr:hypothetical protein CDAR_278701 [Caerostris darwini]